MNDTRWSVIGICIALVGLGISIDQLREWWKERKQKKFDSVESMLKEKQ